MNFSFLRLLPLVLGVCLFTSCEKKELPVTLPPKGDAMAQEINIGTENELQVFFKFSTGSIVKTSNADLWDLSFETSGTDGHMYINGGKKILAYNTHQQEMAGVITLPQIQEEEWAFDDPSGNPNQTAIGDWENGGNSKGEVYILRMGDKTYKKIRIAQVTDKDLLIEYCGLASTTSTRALIPLDTNYSLAYFSFTNGIVLPDPPKESYDISFTRYHYVYRNLGNFLYEVNGVRLNPYKTLGTADSTINFNNVNENSAMLNHFTDQQDVIGFDWKQFSFATQLYEMKPWKCYAVKTMESEIYKLHFLAFYSNTGERGHILFEYDRLK